jgi:glutamate 5-kinase
VGADKLILLSDVPGVLEMDGHGELTNRIIPVISRVTPTMQRGASKKNGSRMSTGGIAAKFAAAKIATAAGIETWVGPGARPDTVSRILKGAAGVGTRFPAKRKWK